MHARKHQNTPDLETGPAKSEDAPVLSSSNAATLEENGLASTGETSMLADAMHILGDAAPVLLPALPLGQLVKLNPLHDPAVAAEVMKHSAAEIAQADPELAYRLVARCFPVGHGLEFSPEVRGRIAGIPLAAESSMAFWHATDERGRIELERSMAVAWNEDADHASVDASVGLEQALDIEFELDVAQVLEVLGVAACFQGSSVSPLTMALAPLAIDAIREETVTDFENRLVASVEGEAIAREDLMAEAGPFRSESLNAELFAALEASLEVGGDVAVIQTDEGPRFEVGLDGSGRLGGELAAKIPGLAELDQALWIRGEGSARVIAWPDGSSEVHVTSGFRGEGEALVYNDLSLAAAAITDSTEATDVGAAIERSGLAGLTRSVTVDLPKDEESEVLPGFVEHTELLGTDRELAIEASCRVSAAAVAPLFRGLTPPPGRTANEVALDALRACIDLTRGQRLPDWLGAIDPLALLAAFELDSPRIIGRVSRKASMGKDFEAGAEAAWLVDTPYEGELDLDQLWKRV